MNLSQNQKLTVFGIGCGLANTTRTELTVATLLPVPFQVRYDRSAVRVGTYKPRGKRKEYYLDVSDDTLVFEGWDLVITSDYEVTRAGGSRSFCGNACLNLGAPSIEVLRDWIDKRNLNEGFKSHGVVLFVEAGSPITDDGVPVYPEIDVAHAVINQIKEKAACV